MVDSLVKERLTGAIILVGLIVLLVPEVLTGPVRSAPAPQGAAPAAGEPPLRSYTIDLADESHTRATTAPADGLRTRFCQRLRRRATGDGDVESGAARRARPDGDVAAVFVHGLGNDGEPQSGTG